MTDIIKMENPPEGFNVEFWKEYGFTANHRTTTNGSLGFLLGCLKLRESKNAVMEFAREVAEEDDLAKRMVDHLDAITERRHD